jgi:alpha-L-rhamnosidase
MTAAGLRCEYLTNPLGLDVPHPRLFWKLNSERPGARQTAYRILAATSEEALARGEGDRWDSGRVESSETLHIRYEGTPAGDLERIYWKVMAWDEHGQATPWSEVAFWEGGLSTWRSAWIGDLPLGGRWTSPPVSYLRREFQVGTSVARARLVVTALGLVKPYLNGEPVGDDCLTPGWTHYHRRVRYRVYDVTDRVASGWNCLGALLGDGWFSGHVEWRGRQLYGERPLLRAELHLEFEDGSREVVLSDASWRAAYGEILEADLIMGVAVDARRALPRWCRDDADMERWRPVLEGEAPEGLLLEGWRSPTIRATQEIRPVSRTEMPAWPQTDQIFDMGQNMVGHVRVRVRGPRGSSIRIRYGERLDEKGRLYTANLRSARQTDYYTLAGDPEGEVFEPTFTFHGFQYVEIRGDAEPVPKEDVTGVVVHSDLLRTGDFQCSDALVNQLQRNIDWGWRGNSVDVPTDCPQRDERLGWTGDAQVFVRTATFNRDAAGFFAKYTQDLEDAQSLEGAIPPVAPHTTSLASLEGDGGPAWADAFVIVPWTIYLSYGDREILRRHYPAMKRYVGFLEARSIDHIRSHPEAKGFAGFGDWLNTNAETPNDLIGTAFFAHSARLLSRIAAVLGEEADARRFSELADAVRDAFNRRFVTSEGRIVSETQTAYVLALHFDLLPEAQRPNALQALVDNIGRRGYKLSTGFVGTPYLPHVLTDNGRPDVAYRLLMQKEWPSYLYAVTQGATTIWERWDGWTHDKGFQDVGMNSFNHYAYGAVGEWLYARVAGLDLDPERPGYRHLQIRPVPNDVLDHASAHLETLHGRAEVSWRREDGKLQLHLRVPPNCTATVRVPLLAGREVQYDTEPSEKRDDVWIYEVAAGGHRWISV